jgi:hypothetical protein
MPKLTDNIGCAMRDGLFAVVTLNDQDAVVSPSLAQIPGRKVGSDFESG